METYDKQSLSEAFDGRRADMWARLERARRFMKNMRHAQFVSLSKRTSMEGNLCGVRLFEPRWPFGRREVAEVIISNDRGDPEGRPPLSETGGLAGVFAQWLPRLRGYSIAVWRRGCFPKVVFETGDSLDLEANAEATADAFCGIMERAKSLMAEHRLSRDFPEEWTGDSWQDVFAREYIQPRAQMIRTAIFAIAFGGPAALIGGLLMPPRLVLPIAVTLLVFPMAVVLFFVGLLGVWVAGVPVHPISRKQRWAATVSLAILATLLAFAWWMAATWGR